MIIHEFEQYSEQWWSYRLSKPSASKAKLLITSTGLASKSMKDYAIELANDLYAGEVVDAWDGNKYTERGSELEEEARDSYIFLNDIEVNQIGMFSDDENKYIASPDGIVGNNGLLEIKCLTAKNHTKALIYFDKNKKPPSEYIAQLQMQLFVSEREWVDIMFYHPKLPNIIIRVLPDKGLFDMLDKQIDALLTERDRVIGLLRER